MTGIAELNFPAFNQEAERLRAEGLQVLNPADHGIVDGADWADYLRHDIAGLSSCERIHLLRGWTKSKGACLEMTIAKALGMTVTYQVDAEMEHNNAPAVPQGWKLVPVEPTEAMSIAGGIAWESSLADDVIGPLEDAWAAMLAATPAPAPAQEVDEAQIQKLRENGAKAWAGVDAQQLRAGFAAPSQEPVACGLCQGSGVLSPTQKCICQYGGKEPAQEEVGLILSAEDVHAAFTKNFPKSRIEKRKWYLEFIKTCFCVDCGEDDRRCLEFHHLKNKTSIVSRVLSSGSPLETLKLEISKCEVLCVNCHRKKTWCV
jgi:hypothetical protein